MPNCLSVAGLQHIINNMLDDVHKAIPWWDTCLKYLKQFEALLRSEEKRQRLTWTCLRNTEFEIEEK